MTAAADELAVTPGAISKQVRQLEETLGVELFGGTKHSPELTHAGRILLSSVSLALDQIESAVRAASEESSRILDVSCFSTFSIRWLIPRLYSFHSGHPDIEVRLTAAERLVDVEREHFDVVITLDQGQSPPAVPAHTLFTEWLGPVMSPRLAERVCLDSPATLPAQLLLRTRTRPDAWSLWAQQSGRHPPRARGPEFEHYYFTLQAAAGELGVCIAPWHLVVDDLASGLLVAPVGFCSSGNRYVAMQRARSKTSADRFCEWLVQRAAEMPEPTSV